MSRILKEKISECREYLGYYEDEEIKYCVEEQEILSFIESTESLFELNDCVRKNINSEIDEYSSLMYLLDSLRYKLEKEDSAVKDQLITNLSEQVKNLKSKININFVQNQTNNQKQSFNLSITLEQTMEKINKSLLSENDKDIIIGKLISLQNLATADEKDKDKIWDKAKGILAWITDKGVDAGIALLPTLPLVAQLLQSIK